MEILMKINSFAHIISSSLALILGAIILMQSKGSARHRNLGVWYFWMMVITNISCLFIMKAFGKWFFPHYLGLAILGMVLSYYLLVGGAINEAFLHIPALRPLIVGGGSPQLGMTHMVAQIVFVGLLIYFLRKYRKWGSALNTNSAE